jgi:hypothetical protein
MYGLVGGSFGLIIFLQSQKAFHLLFPGAKAMRTLYRMRLGKDFSLQHTAEDFAMENLLGQREESYKK